ncbi:MAG: hypothetical protein RKO66_04285 [Candidatus Contendobacter sp.]|nr:hypothetical protein [Candidatus Contendobacter sp.]MDS4058487.1 hypothetical protein [Candidatus Contendobacter sp.]
MLKGLISRLKSSKPSQLRVPDGQRLYRCLAHGENFPGAILSRTEAIGFYTTRFVVAKDAQTAEMLVLEMLRAEPGLQLPEGVDKPMDARVSFERIEEVPNDTPPQPNAGFTFYVMGT